LTLKDLYTPHPTKPDLWVYKGRTDDMLVLSSGEKVRPLPMEAIINTHPAVKDCLMVSLLLYVLEYLNYTDQFLLLHMSC
jgi:hypothetical protein